MFELEDLLSLTLYVYIIDFSFSVIIVQNKMNQSITVKHNQCLDYFTEIDYEDCYYITVNKFMCDLIIQKSQITHKTD